MKTLKSMLTLVALCVAALFTTSCVEDSTVIRVKKDGSGEIFARSYMSPQVAQMMGGIMGDLGGDADAAPPSPAESMIPEQAELEAKAGEFGEGVRYVRIETGKNGKGWDGFVAVYEFDDVSTLKIDPFSNPADMEGAEDLTDVAADAALEQPVTFAMADGVLTINIEANDETFEGLGEAGGGPGADAGGEDMQAQMAMMLPMLQGMRFGTFVRIDGGIAETNAQHVDGTLITISDFEPAKMMSDPNFEAITKEAEALGASGVEPDDAAVKEMMEKIQTIDGVKFETQEQVTVTFE